jgi:hypothetical protein
MPKPQHYFAPIKDDFYVYAIGCVMRYVEVGYENKVRVLKSFKHGFDGISALEGDPHKEVYAIAEKSTNPRVHICKVDKIKKDEYQQRIVAKLTGIFLATINKESN